jgi:hypothetical protein
VKVAGHLGLATYCKELIPLTTVGLSGLTVLLPFTDVGSENQHVAVILENADPTIAIDLIVDVSHGGLYPNSARRQIKTAQPNGDEVSIEITSPNPYTYIRVSAQPASGTPNARYAIVAQER